MTNSSDSTTNTTDGAAMVAAVAQVVSAFVARNDVSKSDLPALIADVHKALSGLSVEAPVAPAPEPEAPQVPAVSIRKSVTADYLICLEDGKKFKSLKRHLRAQYGLTPEQYREKWKLPSDYPMVAASYAKRRSVLAKAMGLGNKSRRSGPKSPP